MPLFTIAAFCVLLTSCATLVNGPTEDVPVTTIPPGAVVTEEQTSTLTPVTFTLERDRDYVLTITKEGYHTENIKIEHVISAAEAGNVFFGVLGVAIDVATGSAWALEPDNLIITLRPLSPDELVDEGARLNKKTLQDKLHALERLKEANLITENQYVVLRELTIHCVSLPGVSLPSKAR